MVNEFQKMINLLKIVDEQHRLEGEDERDYCRSIICEVIGMLQKFEQNPVSGSLLLYELMQVAAIKNEDGMPVVSYVDKPNGGSVAYLRHDAVVKKLNSMMDTPFPSADDAGVVAVKVSESVEPQLTAQEQAYFIAGFIECVKWLSGHCNDC